MTKHTPGPWRVDRRAATRIVAGTDDTVATTGCQGDLRDSWEANAVLAAAAPDLLDAVRKCYAALVSHCDLATQYEQEIALASIAKATGES